MMGMSVWKYCSLKNEKNLVNLNVLYLKGPLGSAACLSKKLWGAIRQNWLLTKSINGGLLGMLAHKGFRTLLDAYRG